MAQDVATPTKEALKQAEQEKKAREKKEKEDAKLAKVKAEEDRKAEERKQKEDKKLKKEMGPDPINSVYDRFTDKSVVSFYSKIIDDIWENGTALLLGGEYNFPGSDISKSKSSGAYFVRLAYIFKGPYPMSSHSLIMIVDGERIDFGNLQVSNYNKASSENILVPGGGIVVYTYVQVTREMLTKLSNAKLIEARLNLWEFQAHPRYMNTMREFLAQVPEL